MRISSAVLREGEQKVHGDEEKKRGASNLLVHFFFSTTQMDWCISSFFLLNSTIIQRVFLLVSALLAKATTQRSQGCQMHDKMRAQNGAKTASKKEKA